jgi:glutamyl-tRNA reductase
MSFIAVGLNHDTAPHQVRGRFAIAPDRFASVLARIRQDMRIDRVQPETALLSTCNRTELYCAADGPGSDELVRRGVECLANLGEVSSEAFSAYGFVKHDVHVVRHAFRVASGLESMVLGEPQILGQLKQAVAHAGQAGSLGRNLMPLFQRSFSVAKEVRSTTAIGTHSVSLAAAAVRVAAEQFGDLSRIKLLLVGAGEMIDLVATHFAARRPGLMVVANRGNARAEALARQHRAESMSLTDLPMRLGEFDVVVSCTASPVPIIGLGAAERAQTLRGGRATLMIDLAVPCDIEAEVARLPGVRLFSIDDLGARIHAAGEQRRAAVGHAEAIIEERVQGFIGWLERRTVVPLIQAVHQRVGEWQAVETTRARKRLARGADPVKLLGELADGVGRKLLHGVLAELNTAEPAARAEVVRIVERMFLRASTRRSLRR